MAVKSKVKAESEDQEEDNGQIKGGGESKRFKEVIVKAKCEIEANKKEINDKNGCE